MRRRAPHRLFRVVAATVVAGGIALPVRTLASPVDTHGLGSRSIALGGAVSADARDVSAVYYNPAGLAAAPGLTLAAGYLRARHALRTNGLDNGVADAAGVAGGVVAPGRLRAVPFAFGVAAHLPDEGLSRVEGLRQEVPRWELYDNRSELLFLATALAVRPLEGFELGIALGFLSATRGRFSVRGTADLARPEDSQLRHEVDADLTSVRYPLAGVRYSRGPVTLAAVYRGEAQLDVDLAADLEGDVAVAGVRVPVRYEVRTTSVSAFLPRHVALGVSLRAGTRVTLVADVTWENWSRYRASTPTTEAELDVSPPEGAEVEVPEPPRPTRPEPPRFRDRVVPRAGAELVLPLSTTIRALPGGRRRALWEAPLRVGYSFRASPVPPQTGPTNFLDADRHAVSLGAGLALTAPGEAVPATVSLDLHVERSILPRRETRKASAADFVGDHATEGAITAAGLTATLAF